jgi:hypothetical protein
VASIKSGQVRTIQYLSPAATLDIDRFSDAAVAVGMACEDQDLHTPGSGLQQV